MKITSIIKVTLGYNKIYVVVKKRYQLMCYRDRVNDPTYHVGYHWMIRGHTSQDFIELKPSFIDINDENT